MTAKPIVIDLRSKAKADLAEWYKTTVVDPFVSRYREMDFTDDEINILFNIAIQPTMAWNERPY